MSNEKMFEVATRSKMRFNFKGLISVEDLWDLSVGNLDTVFKSLNSQVKQAKEESLLDKKTKADETLDMQIEIVKYIVGVKLDEENTRLQAKAKREHRQELMAILSEKEKSELRDKSAEEIRAMLDKLD